MIKFYNYYLSGDVDVFGITVLYGKELRLLNNPFRKVTNSLNNHQVIKPNIKESDKNCRLHKEKDYL